LLQFLVLFAIFIDKLKIWLVFVDNLKKIWRYYAIISQCFDADVKVRLKYLCQLFVLISCVNVSSPLLACIR